MPTITRFPPSPTGYLHLGRARTALFNYLFAKQNGGKMIFRFEDTDSVRSRKEFEEIMIESLIWLGISWDNKVIERQTERAEKYKECLKKLVQDNKAYISKETILEGERAGQVNEVVRFRNPNKKITFTDLIRGVITIDTTDLEDFIIARNIDSPLYHLAVVIDDFEMGVTHIIRGEDGISNTPRQILIQEAIGAPLPIYAHLPLILAPDRSKLSGRHGAVSVTEYKVEGYLPEAMVNYLALLGWNPGTDQEIFSMDELIKAFDLSKVQKSGAIFNPEKLKWFNRQYILKLSDVDFAEHARPYLPEWIVPKSDLFNKLVPVLRDKIVTFGEISSIFTGGTGELAFVKELQDYRSESLLWKKNPDATISFKHLTQVYDLLKMLALDAFTADTIKLAVWPYVEANGKGDVLWPLRMALTGQDKSPDPFVSAALLGKDEALKRIQLAIGKLTS